MLAPTNLRLHAALAIATLVSLGGCAISTDLGSGEGGVGLVNGSCLQTLSTSGISFQFCADYVGLTADQMSAIQMVCTAGADAGTSVSTNGTFSAGACAHVGAVGACQIAAGGFMETLWYWPITGTGMDVSQFHDQCVAAHGTWVMP